MPPHPRRRRLRRLTFLVLCCLIAGLTVCAGAALLMVNQHARQLARPNTHSELWQAYQLHAELERSLETAQAVLDERADSDALATRIEVLASLLPPLRTTSVFSHLAEPRPEIDETLNRLERISGDWLKRAPWGQPAAARNIAEEMLRQLPLLLKPTHEIIVATHIAQTNMLDDERQDLQHAFVLLAWVLAGLGICCVLLTLRVIANSRRKLLLTQRLNDLNQSLERRVEQRTQELTERKALLRYILDTSPSDVALLNDRDSHAHYVSPRLLQRTGADDESFNLTRLFNDPDEESRFLQALDEFGRLDGWETRLAGDPPYWAVVWARRLNVEGQPASLVWSFDINQRKAIEQELRLLATTDPLTGLQNRHAFVKRGVSLLKSAQRYHRQCSALMLDIDHFKRINDTHGHAFGDAVLKAVAAELSQGLREVDLLGRLGGEEFAAILPETDPQQALQVAERLRTAVQSLIFTGEDGSRLDLTLSIGVAERRPGEVRLEDLLARADRALYRAKAGGRNRTEQAPS
ncbi:GGDEF domain-containing protein [Pseudomonas sp. ZM23]|uniref:diguanylate cyclase n=1 Tax=Pseudomonas triclosanedens TaxID=2961893 RepID=A0ABY6ZSV8_9PSED|nr:GGDEF domain-containing protein [Pseudomonas triclosanedens]MCP8467319.1 GGDEF domain-containing protein [Pseudomonas triclosanedens]MCP8472646.1 GGDEF domain-containing protein [Pseudomonas triclosanedens]MCP8478707.1 GGDEF domain-containing protein [Pseudomonas triclosanedens]WAI47881.1 GGDEF domain-containing protein [Pseudomonas triclosanedens]